MTRFDELVGTGSSEALTVDPGAVTADTLLLILFTSGTTAAPKGVTATHANALWAGESGARDRGGAGVESTVKVPLNVGDSWTETVAMNGFTCASTWTLITRPGHGCPSSGRPTTPARRPTAAAAAVLTDQARARLRRSMGIAA